MEAPESIVRTKVVKRDFPVLGVTNSIPRLKSFEIGAERGRLPVEAQGRAIRDHHSLIQALGLSRSALLVFFFAEVWMPYNAASRIRHASSRSLIPGRAG